MSHCKQHICSVLFAVSCIFQPVNVDAKMWKRWKNIFFKHWFTSKCWSYSSGKLLKPPMVKTFESWFPPSPTFSHATRLFYSFTFSHQVVHTEEIQSQCWVVWQLGGLVPVLWQQVPLRSKVYSLMSPPLIKERTLGWRN